MLIRNLLVTIGFLTVALAGAAGLYAAGWSRFGPVDDGDGAVRRLAVSTSGLDLSTIAGQDLLDRRVEAAINRVCRDVSGLDFASFGDERRCRRDARLGADRQIAAAVDRATRRADYARAYEQQSMASDQYDVPDERGYAAPILPAPAYAPRPESVVRSIDTHVVRKRLKPRVKWVRTRHGWVKKTVHRKLVRKTVKTVYVR